MNLYNEIKKIKERGYNEASAQSKLGQDIILKAIHDSGMAKSTTIKGGVVMRSLSNNSRRAPQDLLFYRRRIYTEICRTIKLH